MQWTRLAVVWGLFSVFANAEDQTKATRQLTSANFDHFLAEAKHTMVKFYAPWCEHCKTLAPEYEKAAQVLQKKGVLLGEVDAVEEKDLSDKYNITGFPVVLFFKQGNLQEYDGTRTADGIVQWVEKMTGPAVTYVESVEDVPVHSNEGTSYTLKVPARDHAVAAVFEEVADQHRSLGTYIILVDKQATQASLEVTHGSLDTYVMPTVPTTAEEILEFVKLESTPLFGPVSQQSYRQYANKGDNWVWFAASSDDYDKFKADLSKLARTYRAEFNFVWLDIANALFKKHATTTFGVSAFPGIVVVKQLDKYRYEGSIDETSLAKYIEDCLQGKAQKYIMSEEVPKTNDEPVKVVVAKSFNDMVLQKDKDVFLEIYAPWCGHCNTLKPIWEELAVMTADSPNFIVAKMDGTANEAVSAKFAIRGYPTLFFVPAGADEPVTFEGDRTVQQLLKFAKSHAKHPIIVKKSEEETSKDEL